LASVWDGTTLSTKRSARNGRLAGARQAEQVQVLRRLWSENLVSFNGRFHNLNEVSIVPPPVQRPIPIWFGGSSDAAVMRAARLGDGWMPIMAADAQAEQKLGLPKTGRLRRRVGVDSVLTW
jgi:alkanesulfonate monooxygenase SsuD/methylene tetrahydromethanopterin reductase-like flavin-dependent oxidoreductase (luciferase family)